MLPLVSAEFPLIKDEVNLYPIGVVECSMWILDSIRV